MGVPLSSPSSKNRIRRGVIRLLFAVATIGTLAVVTAHVYLLNLDRYRPRLESTISEATGFRISLGHIGVQYFPTRQLILSSLEFADDDGFGMRVDDVSMTIDLFELVKGKIDILSIQVRNVELELPEDVDAWKKKYDETVGNFAASEDAKESRLKLEAIREVTLDHFETYVSGSSEALFSLTVRLLDVASDNIGVTIGGNLPRFGETAAIQAGLSIGLDGNGKVDSIDITGRASEIRLPLFGSEQYSENLVVSFAVDSSSSDLENFILPIRADVEVLTDPALSGRATGEILYDRKRGFELSSAEYVSDGLNARFRAGRDGSGDIAIAASEIMLSTEGLSSLATRLPEERVRLAPLRDSYLSVTGLLVKIDDAGVVRIDSGRLNLSGIELDFGDGRMLARVDADASYEDGTLHVREFSVGGARATGWIRPNFEDRSLDFELNGEADFEDGVLEALLGLDSVRKIAGRAELTRASGTYRRNDGFSDNICLEGRISDGGFEFLTGDDVIGFEDVEIELVIANKILDVNIQSASHDIGNIAFQGALNLNDFKLDGVLAADTRLIASHILTSDDAQRYASVIEQFDDIKLNLDIALPYIKRDGLSVHAFQQTFPHFEASAEWAVNEEGILQLGDISATTRIQVAEVDSELSGPLYGTGEASIVFTRIADDESFDLLLDFQDTSVRIGERIEKRPGHPLSIHVTGRAPAKGWSAESIQIQCLDERVDCRFEDGVLTAKEARVRLANLAGLLPDEARASGDLIIDFDTGQDYLSISFKDAGIRFSDGVGVDRVDGDLVILGDSVQFNDIGLHYRAGSCTINASSFDGYWKGSIRGEYLDLNTMIAAFQEARLRRHRDADEKKAPLEIAKRRGSSVQNVSPMRGEIVLDLDRLLFRRATFSDVHARFLGEEKGILIRDISLVPGQGTISGTANFMFADKNMWAVALDFVEIDNRLLDELLFDEDRQFRGTASGKFRFESELTDLQDMLASGNGHCEWTINDGSFGKLGWATRLLKVLKTTEIFSLRLPSIRDDGLTFDQCTGKVAMEDGVLQLNNAILASPSYRMSADGKIDFSEEDADVRVFVHLLEPIGKITRRIPGVKQVAAVTTDRIGIPILVSGNPYDLDYKVGRGHNVVGTSLNQVGETTKSISKGVLGAFKKVVGVLP